MNTRGMNILAFDTTTSACAAAICRGGDVVAERTVAMDRGHAEALIPMLEAILASASLGYSDLDAIAVTRGPGAFTGIRIGLAAARGLALASGLPVVGVTTLEAMAATARAHTERNRIVIVMDTKRRDFFVQAFNRELTPLCDPAVMSGADVASRLAAIDGLAREDCTVAGDGLAQAAALQLNPDIELLPTVTTPAPLCIATLAAGRIAVESLPPTPLYLRPPEARLPTAGP